VSLAHRKTPPVLCEGKPLQVWILENSSGNPAVRAPLLALGRSAVPELINLVNAKDPFPTRQLWTLASLLPPRAQKAVAPQLRPLQADQVHAAAAQWLGILGQDATSAVPALVHAMQDRNGTVCWSAATALGRIGTNSLTALIDALRTKRQTLREAATSALGSLGPGASPAVAVLVNNLADTDPQLRASTAWTLGRIGPSAKAAVPELVRLSEDQDPAVRLAAKDTLNRLSNPVD
jgi:HEAT repeat protein